MSILSASYSAASQTQSLIPVGAKFAPVDPTKYQGTWTGKDPLGQPFSLKITDVSGYRANVTFESSSGLQYAKVFITSNNSFRIGEFQFHAVVDGRHGAAQHGGHGFHDRHSNGAAIHRDIVGLESIFQFA